jgi:hypothetical protein
MTDLEELRELRMHRAALTIPHEMLFRMMGVGADYLVLGVHTEFATDRVILMVAHPDLRYVYPGCMPPELETDFGTRRELRVVDGQLYARTEMEIGPPGELGRPVATEVREQLRERLQAVLDDYAPEHRLDGILAALAEVAASGDAPFSASRFLEWLR